MAPAQYALVTGVAAGGLGEGHMKALLERGINVITTSIDMKLLENLDSKSHQNPAEVFRLELDVTSRDSIASAVRQVTEITGGRLDFLFSMLAARSYHCSKCAKLILHLIRQCWLWLFHATVRRRSR